MVFAEGRDHKALCRSPDAVLQPERVLPAPRASGFLPACLAASTRLPPSAGGAERVRPPTPCLPGLARGREATAGGLTARSAAGHHPWSFCQELCTPGSRGVLCYPQSILTGHALH